MPARPLDPTLAAVLAALAAGAAAIHLAMVPMHADEWAVLAVGFGVVGWAQAAAAVALAVRPRRWVLTGAAALAVAAVAAWAVSRTSGFPFGPMAGEPEAASTIDLLCVAFEVLLVAGAVVALVRPATARADARRPVAVGLTAASVLAVAGLTTAALAAPSGAHAHDTADAAPEAAAHGHEAEGEQAAAEPAEGTVEADETSAGHEHGHGVVPNQPVDAATREALAAQLVEARQAALRHPTVADATAAGYAMVTTYVPLIGAHYIRWDLVDGTFDVAEPEMLLYDGTGPDARIVGLSYLQFSRAEPEGFAGPNDHWHQHVGLCFNAQLVVVGGSSLTAAECAARGGMKIDGSNGWMVHAWVVPGWESQQGVFSSENSDLR